jgi:hypothetical protein
MDRLGCREDMSGGGDARGLAVMLARDGVGLQYYAGDGQAQYIVMQY